MGWLDRLFRFREKENPDAVKPFLDHLEDLRWTVLKMAATLGVAMAVSFTFRTDLVRILQKPLHDIDPHLVANLQVLGVTDSLLISLKLAFYAGIVLAFPILMFFVAQFVLPALTTREKRLLLPALAVGFGLFFGGVLFSYYWVLPSTLAFFFHDARSMQWTPMWTVRDYFSFVTQMTLALGLGFELPVVVMVLVHLGIINSTFMQKTRPFAIVLVLSLAAVIAPTPDPLTFLSMGVPMYLLYEGCIWLAWLIERRNRRAALLPPAG
jgi:sec-independent protein translocase protein TatC